MKRLVIAAVAVSLVAITGCGSSSSSSGSGGSGSNASGAASDLSNLAEKFKKISFKGTYSYSGGGSNGTYTIYWMPPSSSRFDVEAEGNTTTMIQVGKTSYVCSSTCLKTEGTGNDAASNPVTGLFSSSGGIAAAAAAASGASIKTSHKSIAGMDGTCYSTSAGGAWEYCLSSDGLLLLASTSGYTLKAESLSTDVKASDFEPTGPVEDLANMVPSP